MLQTCNWEVANLLRTYYEETGLRDFGLDGTEQDIAQSIRWVQTVGQSCEDVHVKSQKCILLANL